MDFELPEEHQLAYESAFALARDEIRPHNAEIERIDDFPSWLCLYEVHDLAYYLTPDVDVDMTTLYMEEIGPDSVRVTDATGHPAPETFKIVAGYEDGYIFFVRRIDKEDITIFRLASELIVDTITPFESLRGELIARYSIYSTKSEQFAERRNPIYLV